MAQLALIVSGQDRAKREERLFRLLEFFAVPCRTVTTSTLTEVSARLGDGYEYVVFGAIDTLADADRNSLRRAAAVYAYAAEDRTVTLRALDAVTGVTCAWSPQASPTAAATVSARNPEFTGPMSGIRSVVRIGEGDGILAQHGELPPLVAAADGAAFVQLVNDGLKVYFCASPQILDIDSPVGGNYFDVRNHFLSAVPLVMFITWAFRDLMWQSNELGACFIIDDPLLKTRYGFCDFLRLRDDMRAHGFTTSIAFIPWNWRRTTPDASRFFNSEADLFSVSVHGCDHVSAEFGTTALDALDQRAWLAHSRMGKHRTRTQIEHDPVMVFPQGVFSSGSPSVLKRNGFIAAVNTEVSPVDRSAVDTTIRDVWDLAIMRYGAFPVYTRRYNHHGLENFAFDLLLGKPCFIVAHHEFFRDAGATLVALIDHLNGLNTTLRWRSLREAIQRAYRVRHEGGVRQVRMYATEARLANTDDQPVDAHVSRDEEDASQVARITMNGTDLTWTPTKSGVAFRCTLAAGTDALIRIEYKVHVGAIRSAGLRYEASVAARRMLCELRDEYLQPARALGLKGLISKATPRLPSPAARP